MSGQPSPVRCLALGLMIVWLGGCGGGTPAPAPEQHAHPLGTVDFRVTCTPPAQIEFNRAVALLHNMTYPQAREAFQQVSNTAASRSSVPAFAWTSVEEVAAAGGVADAA